MPNHYYDTDDRRRFLTPEGEKWFLRRAYRRAQAWGAGREQYETLPPLHYASVLCGMVAKYGPLTQGVALLKECTTPSDCRDMVELQYPAPAIDALGLLHYTPGQMFHSGYILDIAKGDTLAHNIAQVVALADLKLSMEVPWYGVEAATASLGRQFIMQKRRERLKGSMRG